MKTTARPLPAYIALFPYQGQTRREYQATEHKTEAGAIKAARKGFGPSKTPGTPYVRDPFAGVCDLPGNASGLYPGQSFRRVEPLTYSEKVAAAVAEMPVFGTFYGDAGAERGQGCLHFRDNPKNGERRRTLSGVYSRAELLETANGAPVFDISGAELAEIFRIADLPLFQRVDAWRAIFCPELQRSAQSAPAPV
jgi:hypothetical protein